MGDCGLDRPDHGSIEVRSSRNGNCGGRVRRLVVPDDREWRRLLSMDMPRGGELTGSRIIGLRMIDRVEGNVMLLLRMRSTRGLIDVLFVSRQWRHHGK